jgi:hypothetical protein
MDDCRTDYLTQGIFWDLIVAARQWVIFCREGRSVHKRRRSTGLFFSDRQPFFVGERLT